VPTPMTPIRSAALLVTACTMFRKMPLRHSLVTPDFV
jgi:hypothetical protein